MKTFSTLPSFVCPVCRNKQTANIKTATHRLIGFINPGEQYISCVWEPCGNIFKGEVMEDLLSKYDTIKPFTNGY